MRVEREERKRRTSCGEHDEGIREVHKGIRELDNRIAEHDKGIRRGRGGQVVGG